MLNGCGGYNQSGTFVAAARCATGCYSVDTYESQAWLFMRTAFFPCLNSYPLFIQVPVPYSEDLIMGEYSTLSSIHSTDSQEKSLGHRVMSQVRKPVAAHHLHLPFHHSHDAEPPRPAPPNRQNSVQTRYMTMLLALDTIPRLHNILASFFTVRTLHQTILLHF